LTTLSKTGISSRPPTEKPARICFVTAGGHHPAIIANALGEAFGTLDIVVEAPERKRELLRRRTRINGIISTVGQFVTMTMIVVMKRVRAAEIEALVGSLGVRTSFDQPHRQHRVETVNDRNFPMLVESLSPDIVFLCGCRMISRTTLGKIAVPVVNYHAGITPSYRGMNGGYWALAQGDPDNFGTTVHLVDAGVDTGAIIGQVRLAPSSNDAIWSYAYGQAAGSRALCVTSVRKVLAGNLRTSEVLGPSRQWFHPTIWNYLATAWWKGVW